VPEFPAVRLARARQIFAQRSGPPPRHQMVKSKTGVVSDMTLAVLHDIRAATLD